MFDSVFAFLMELNETSIIQKAFDIELNYY